jgi:hypothetical protein
LVSVVADRRRRRNGSRPVPGPDPRGPIEQVLDDAAAARQRPVGIFRAELVLSDEGITPEGDVIGFTVGEQGAKSPQLLIHDARINAWRPVLLPPGDWELSRKRPVLYLPRGGRA